MVHARTLNHPAASQNVGTFGNQGGLFMNAMTWFDHETESVWSQVWGLAIDGPLKGTKLELIPASIIPWGTWLDQHPQTLALDTRSLGFHGRQPIQNNWVIGVNLANHQKAYYFDDLALHGPLNDTIGEYPVLLYADPDSRAVHLFLRRVNDHVTTLSLDETKTFLVDQETGAQWNLLRGLPKDGNQNGSPLLSLPYISSFDWAWRDFYPESEFYANYRGKKPLNSRLPEFEYRAIE